jgi:hypothetical protein
MTIAKLAELHLWQRGDEIHWCSKQLLLRTVQVLDQPGWRAKSALLQISHKKRVLILGKTERK